MDGQDPDAVIDEEANDKICRLLKIINHPDLNARFMTDWKIMPGC